jgi:hypothetical protein
MLLSFHWRWNGEDRTNQIMFNVDDIVGTLIDLLVDHVFGSVAAFLRDPWGWVQGAFKSLVDGVVDFFNGIGIQCITDGNCASHQRCQNNPIKGNLFKCEDKLPDGASCTRDTQCQGLFAWYPC